MDPPLFAPAGIDPLGPGQAAFATPIGANISGITAAQAEARQMLLIRLSSRALSSLLIRRLRVSVCSVKCRAIN